MPKGSKTGVRGHMVESADMATKTRKSGALKRWMATIAKAAVAHRAPRYEAGRALAVHMTFYVPKKPSVKRGYPCVKYGGDVDKLCRAVLDALEGVLYANDAQVIDIHARKRYEYGEGVGVLVEVMPLKVGFHEA